MARKTLGNDVSDAFEMFMDTIANAFGGIVFISLLVCVMLQLTQSIKPPDPGEAKLLEAQRDSIQAEIQSALKIKDEQVRQIKALGAIIDPKLLKKYLELVQKEKDLQVAYNDLIAAINAMRLGTDDLTRRLLALEAERNALIEKLEQIKKKGVPDEGARRSPSSLESDRSRSSSAAGECVFFYKFNNEAEPVGENVDDLAITENDTGKFLSLKPGRGVPIDGSAEGIKKIAAAFGKFTPVPKPGQSDAQAHCVSMAVWPDSYSQCAIVRDWLIRNKFEYGLSLMREGQGIQVVKGASATPTFGRR